MNLIPKDVWRVRNCHYFVQDPHAGRPLLEQFDILTCAENLLIIPILVLCLKLKIIDVHTEVINLGYSSQHSFGLVCHSSSTSRLLYPLTNFL